MNDKSLLLKTEMLTLTKQIKLYEYKIEDIPQTKFFFSKTTVLQLQGLSETNEDPAYLSQKKRNYI